MSGTFQEEEADCVRYIRFFGPNHSCGSAESVHFCSAEGYSGYSVSYNKNPPEHFSPGGFLYTVPFHGAGAFIINTSG
jgi:hypothetical protein